MRDSRPKRWARRMQAEPDMAEAARKSVALGASPQEIRDKYDDFRKLLLERQSNILSHLDNERAQLAEQQLLNVGDVGDVADISVADTSSDYFMKLADNDRRELYEIQEALERLQRGDYGICESCEMPIAVERLMKLPYARRCIDCQSALENRQQAGRPQLLPKL